jgi:DNA polymerase-4
VIVHVDMDAFFAAVEQRERPELRGKPVIVGADPGGRGVVATCSYEARVFGVHSAMPIREARHRCPQGVFLPVRMGLYVAASRQVMEILGRYSPLVEPLSIDEAFLDVAGCERLFGPPAEIARLIKADVLECTALHCSAGVAPNKFLAKLATELGKPDGLTVIEPGREREVLEPLPVTKVFGVGKRTAQVLESMGLRTVGELAAAPLDRLARRLGPAAAAHMHALARGEDDRRVEPVRVAQQLGSERTFEHDLADREELKLQLLALAGEVGWGLRRHGFRGAGVRLKVRTEDFTTFTRSRKLARPSDADRVLFRVACELFEASRPSRPVRLLGVAAFDLVGEEDAAQGTLFGPPEDEARAARIDLASDQLRTRFGDTALRPASLLRRPVPPPKVTRKPK